MATTKETPKNVWRKLMDTRIEFISKGVKKTGKNMSMKYKFFELDDLVTESMPLFSQNGLFPYTYFTTETCCLDIIDMDNPDSVIHFFTPMREWTGNAAVNPVQSLGGTITYMRRYLLMLALDVVEADAMDAGLMVPDNGAKEVPAEKETVKEEPAPEEKKAPASVPVVTPTKPKVPVSQQERAEIKTSLTDANGKATDLQIRQLKDKLKEVRAKCKGKDQYVQGVVLNTKSFSSVTKAECEKLIQECVAMIKEATDA